MWWFWVPTDQWHHTHSSMYTKLRNLHYPSLESMYKDISAYTNTWNCHLHHSTQMYLISLLLLFSFFQDWLQKNRFTPLGYTGLGWIFSQCLLQSPLGVMLLHFPLSYLIIFLSHLFSIFFKTLPVCITFIFTIQTSCHPGIIYVNFPVSTFNRYC